MSFFEPAGPTTRLSRDGAPGVSIPKTRRPDSQQQKMNTLQNSSGLSSSLTQRFFIKNLLERKVDYSTLMRSQRLSPAGLGEEVWSATALLVQKYAALRLIVLLPVKIYPQ